MTWVLALRAEVGRRLNQSYTKELLPEAIDGHACSQRGSVCR